VIRMGVDPFDPDEGPLRYMYVRVADHLAARIEAGELAGGSRLPSNRDLADTYGVTVGTIRQALEELRRRGMVDTLPAKGTFVAKRTA
jgi:GntR family transcriptional regulator